MANKKTSGLAWFLDIVIKLGIVSVLLGIPVALVVSFFTEGSPVLFLENGCPPMYSNDSSTYSKLEFAIRNRGDVPGYASVCLKSEEVGFKDTNGQSLICYREQLYEPMSTEIYRTISTGLVFSGKELPKNITIQLYSDCKSYVWGLSFLPKGCEGLSRICKYQKDNYLPNYILIK